MLPDDGDIVLRGAVTMPIPLLTASARFESSAKRDENDGFLAHSAVPLFDIFCIIC